MIIGDLEYLMASLPYLSFHNTPELRHRVRMLLKAYARVEDETADLVQLLDGEAAKFLSPGALSTLRAVQLTRVHQPAYRRMGSPTLSEFSRYAGWLKEEVRHIRLRRRAGNSRSDSEDSRGLQLQGTPLDQEVRLMRYQWDKLEELSGGHHADLDALIIYKLKLMILLRWWQFDARRGFDLFVQKTKEY